MAAFDSTEHQKTSFFMCLFFSYIYKSNYCWPAGKSQISEGRACKRKKQPNNILYQTPSNVFLFLNKGQSDKSFREKANKDAFHVAYLVQAQKDTVYRMNHLSVCFLIKCNYLPGFFNPHTVREIWINLKASAFAKMSIWVFVLESTGSTGWYVFRSVWCTIMCFPRHFVFCLTSWE